MTDQEIVRFLRELAETPFAKERKSREFGSCRAALLEAANRLESKSGIFTVDVPEMPDVFIRNEGTINFNL